MKEKVYCEECRYWVRGETVGNCKAPKNLNKKMTGGTWFKRPYEYTTYIGWPSLINKNNDCAHYKEKEQERSYHQEEHKENKEMNRCEIELMIQKAEHYIDEAMGELGKIAMPGIIERGMKRIDENTLIDVRMALVGLLEIKNRFNELIKNVGMGERNYDK